MGIFVILFILAGLIIGAGLLIAVFFSEEVQATKERDPAAKGYAQIVFLYSGLHAVALYRISHALWGAGFKGFARAISQIGRFLTGIEIHPGAQIARGLFIDHGMGVVIGETAIIGNNVTLYQGVTLGGTGKETGKRHPTLGDNIVVGAGAKVLGNIAVGSNSYIGANAVVIKNVPENATVVGVPGHVTKQDGKKIDVKLAHSRIMDPIMEDMDGLTARLERLEKKLGLNAETTVKQEKADDDEDL